MIIKHWDATIATKRRVLVTVAQYVRIEVLYKPNSKIPPHVKNEMHALNKGYGIVI